jgi:CubicO group peptidase (beta-lactamase class C family)
MRCTSWTGFLLSPVLAVAAACGSSSNDVAPADDTGTTSDTAVASDASSDAPSDDASPDASLDDPPIDDKYAAFAAAFDAERKTMGAPGAAVAIIEHGKVTFFHGFGTKGPSSGEPVRARTLFRIGSMTKALTATACLSLVDAGKMDPKALLTKYVPDAAIDGDELKTLTLGQLLSHSSGLRDYLTIKGPKDDASLSTFLTGSVFRGNEYFMDPPGSMWNYSNPNFYLAGLAAERVDGVSYRESLGKRVLAPLGMTRTFFLGSEVLADGDFTNGKSTDSAGKPWDVSPDSYENSWARPAGYAWSNVLDYARFVQFLYAGNTAVLSDAQRTAMQAPQVSTLEFGDAEGYGYGLFSNSGFRLGTKWYATKLVHHGGDIPGFAADFYLVPSSGFGVVTFANTDGAHFQKALVTGLLSFAELPASTTLPSEASPDTTRYPEYAGIYDDPHNVGTVTVTASGSVVTVSMPDLDKAGVPYEKTLSAASLDNFVLGIQGTQTLLTFIKDGTGAYRYLRTRPFVAVRPATPAMRTIPFVVDAAALRERLRVKL